MPAEMVSVIWALAPVRLMGDCENAHAAPAGSPEQARLTGPVNPLLVSRVNVAIVLWPRVTVKELEEE